MHAAPPADRQVARIGNPPNQAMRDTITILFRAKRFQEAREAIEHGLLDTPNDTFLLRRLVLACNHLGDHETADDASSQLAEVIESQKADSTPHVAAEYEHDAVSPSEYAELLGAELPSTHENNYPAEPVASAHGHDDSDEAEASPGHADVPSDAGDIAETSDTDEPLLSDADALKVDIEESPEQLLAEAFAEASGRQNAVMIFDDQAEGLDALDLIEIQEARQATKLTGSARITRRLRARQQAAAMLGRFGYGETTDIDAIAEIFFHFGWNSCRRALEDQLHRGATPSDLAVAHRARLAWSSNPMLNASAAFANDRWRAPQSPFPSWALGIALTKAFAGVPSDAEIDALLEREFDRYLGSNALQRDYGSFSAYLCDCRLDSTGRYLPPSMPSDFDSDWSLTDRDPADRWEACVPVPRVFNLAVFLDSYIDR